MDAEVLAYLDAAYEPLRLLRRTDRGEVWLAVGRDGRPVIRKRIALSGLPYAQLMELQCPLCPQILYCAEEDGETVLVEEHIPGEPLSERLAKGSHLDEEEARDILLQVAEGLLPIHEAGIVHRDIKPAHLLREKSGRIRLIDFDASRLVKEGKAEDTSRLGTKGYASPEQFGYGQTDARSDIYSLGVTVKELLGPGYRGWLSPVLDKCTQVDMDRRYASLSELREALLHPWRRRLKRTALAALLVFLAAIALYGTWHHGREGAVEPGMPAAPGAEEVPETPSEERREEPPAAGKDSAASGMQSPPSPGTQETKAPAAPAQPSARKDPGSASHAEPAASSPAEGIPLREDAAPAEAPNHIRAQIFVNGEYSNAWMENWDTDITNAGSTLEIPRKLWDAWRDAPGGPLQLPEDWNARIHIANHTDQPWENPWVQLHYTSQGREETSVLQGRTLAPGESMDFDIPLGNYRIDHPEQGTNTTGGELAIQIHGDGPQELYCSRYSIGFMCREE